MAFHSIINEIVTDNVRNKTLESITFYEDLGTGYLKGS